MHYFQEYIPGFALFSKGYISGFALFQEYIPGFALFSKEYIPGFALFSKEYISGFALFQEYGKCSKISNTLKLRTPKIIAENNF